MHKQRRENGAVLDYFGEITSEIITKAGKPGDRFHLGKIILHGLRSKPEFVLQIDGATGESETNHQALEKAVLCANAMRHIGLNAGDVTVLMAPNHVDLCAPFYASLFLGLPIAAVDRNLGTKELQDTFVVLKPKILFCQSEKASDIQLALNEAEVDCHIIPFDKGDYLCSFQKFLEKYGDGPSVQEFEPVELDTAEALSLLIATSGTTGLPKAAGVTHKNFSISVAMFWARYINFPTPTKMMYVGSPLQWLTAIFNYVGNPILRYTRLQTSAPQTVDHVHYLFNTYQPTITVMSPTAMTQLTHPDVCHNCDFTCFEDILLGGSAVPKQLIDHIKSLAPDAEVNNCYGMSEVGMIFCHDGESPSSSFGKRMTHLQYRLVNVDTNEDIIEPHTPGELWLKGSCIFKEYFNNPVATQEVFSDDGWFKTGDIIQRDENMSFHFVDRLKILLKYLSNQISPVEVEDVIRLHPGVLDVAVTGYPDINGEMPVACVVKKDSNVTAQDIKDLVAENLADYKHLRGGVIFLDSIPVTASTKVHRRKLKEIALNLPRE